MTGRDIEIGDEKEMREKVIGALANIGIKSFLIIGIKDIHEKEESLPCHKECHPVEVISFSLLEAEENKDVTKHKIRMYLLHGAMEAIEGWQRKWLAESIAEAMGIDPSKIGIGILSASMSDSVENNSTKSDVRHYR